MVSLIKLYCLHTCLLLTVMELYLIQILKNKKIKKFLYNKI